MTLRKRIQRSREVDAANDAQRHRVTAAGLRVQAAKLEEKIAALEAQTPPMRAGAVVMLDALGFKGIWKGHRGGAEAVLAKMSRIREELKLIGQTKGPNVPIVMDIEGMCISDTIVIGVRVPRGAELDERSETGTAMAMASCAASKVYEIGLLEEPRFAYRGVISYGQFEMENGFIVGPAIDEAAEQMEQAEAALIWCTPSATDALGRLAPRAYDALCPFTVPLKGGRTFDSQCVIPSTAMAESEAWKTVVNHLTATFKTKTTSLEIAIKKQNTLRFLQAARSHHLEKSKSSL
jgi:hypothetical protein